jgi:hypothetical protein
MHRPISRGVSSDTLLTNSLGDGSTLTLDFTTGILDPRLSFSRLSTATFINSSGLVTSVGNNIPRFDHDPTTLAPKGLLIEGQSENLCRNSNDIYVTGWWGSSAGITATQDTSIPDPSNGTQSCKIVKSAGTQFVVRNQILPTVTVPANSTINVTASVWLRMNGAGQAAASVGIFDIGGTGFGTRNGAFVSNSAVTISSGSGSDVDFTFGSVTGWVRVGVTRSITNSTGSPVSYTQLSFFIYPDRNSTNTATIFAWGAQFEISAGASSLIPTGASQATRNADYCVMPTSSFITGNPYPNTLFVDCIPMTPNAGFLNLVRLYDRTAGGTYSYGSEIYYYSAASMISQRKISASTNTDRNFANGLAYNTRHKFAISVDSTAFIGSYDGVTGLGPATAPAALPSVVTHLGVGNAGDASALNVMNGWLRQIKFWPTALPQATINSLTTL